MTGPTPAEFSAAMREAEAEAGVTSEPDPLLGFQRVHPEPAEAEQEPQRDEQGRFAATEQEQEAPAAEATAAAETTAEEQRRFAGKYESPEELERAYEELQALQGRHANEVGQLRQQVEQLVQTQQTAQLAPLGDVETLIYENPAYAGQVAQQALERAVQTGDFTGYDRAMGAWEEVNKPMARSYDRQVQVWLAEQRVMQQFGPQIAPAQQLAQQNQLQQAIANTAGRHTDFGDIVGALTEQRLGELVQGGFPQAVLAGLEGDAASKEQAVETLYRWLKADRADTLAAASQQAAQQQNDAARAEKAQAGVASATRSSAAPAEPETEAERLAQSIAGHLNRTRWRR